MSDDPKSAPVTTGQEKASREICMPLPKVTSYRCPLCHTTMAESSGYYYCPRCLAQKAAR